MLVIKLDYMPEIVIGVGVGVGCVRVGLDEALGLAEDLMKRGLVKEVRLSRLDV